MKNTWWIISLLLLKISYHSVFGLSSVPDSITTKKDPPVKGMLVYRMNVDTLNFMSDKKVPVVAEKKETTNEMKTLSKKVNTLENEVKILNTTISKSLKDDKLGNQSVQALRQIVSRNEVGLKKLTKFVNARLRVKLGLLQTPGNSCYDIKKWSNETSLKNGQYWITLGRSKPMKVFCDMNSDGGGWTLISNIVLQNSRGFDWSVTKDYNKISDYSGNKLVLSTQALDALRKQMPFTQLRFFCRKKVPGRTFDIATKKNTLGENVVKYFTAKTNTFPKSCGSYYRLSDDNSKMAKECQNWGYESGKYRTGKWHHENMPVDDRLYNHVAYLPQEAHWFVAHSASGRWECDDYSRNKGYTRSTGDFWKVFVR